MVGEQSKEIFFTSALVCQNHVICRYRILCKTDQISFTQNGRYSKNHSPKYENDPPKYNKGKSQSIFHASRYIIPLSALSVA